MKEIDRWFVAPDGGMLDQQQLEGILTVFAAVAAGLDGSTTYNDTPSDLTEYGHSPIPPDTGPILIGFLYHTTDSLGEYGTVIHELTHLYAGTNDFAYFQNPQALEGPSADGTWDNVVWLTVDDYTQLASPSTGQLLNNADSYAGFLTQFYQT